MALEAFQQVFFGGLAAPFDMNGLRRLGEKIVAAGIPSRQLFMPWDADVTSILTYRQSLSPDDQLRIPLVLVGHSYGGSAATRLERQLGTRVVAASFKIDPVPIWGWGMSQANEFTVTDNVRLAQFYVRDQFTWLPPWSCGCKNRKGVTRIVPGGHDDLPNSDAVHKDIIFNLLVLQTVLS